MKRIYIVTAITCLFALLCAGGVRYLREKNLKQGVLKVGFVCEGDESTPYSYNFFLGEQAVEEAFPGRIEVSTRSNVEEREAGYVCWELVNNGCGLIFTNSHSEEIAELAEEHPDVQFCQVSWQPEIAPGAPPNYHTFNGEMYQGRYVSGIAAGLKLKEMINSGAITPEQAKAGYVGSYQIPSVISGYTAFLLGIRSVVPDAVMVVRYTNMWSNYTLEKKCAEQLIREGCVVISHHTDTVGAAIACEEAAASHSVCFIGYNQSMLDDAPTTALISTGDNWIPYIMGATEAVLQGKEIEKNVRGTLHGRDMSAGFDRDWVTMFELNTHIAAKNTMNVLDSAVEKLKKGKTMVFQGDYTGTDPDDPSDTCDLREGYAENADYSSPSFHYILDDVITVEK